MKNLNAKLAKQIRRANWRTMRLGRSEFGSGMVEAGAKQTMDEETMFYHAYRHMHGRGQARCPRCRVLGIDFWISMGTQGRQFLRDHILEHRIVRALEGAEGEKLWFEAWRDKREKIHREALAKHNAKRRKGSA